jgi:hypothetical protein
MERSEIRERCRQCCLRTDPDCYACCSLHPIALAHLDGAWLVGKDAVAGAAEEQVEIQQNVDLPDTDKLAACRSSRPEMLMTS